MMVSGVTGSVCRSSQAAHLRVLGTLCGILCLACGPVALFAQPATSGSLAGAPEGEMRAVWLEWTEADSEKSTLSSKLDAIKKAGFNTVQVSFHYIGYVAYPGSAYLSQLQRHAKHGDIIDWYVNEIHRRGMRADLVAEYGFTAHRGASSSSDPGTILNKHPELMQMDTSGTKYTYSPKTGYKYYHMCPSNPKSAEILGSIYAEAASKYPADGFVLSGFCYESEDMCYCDYCKEHFRKDTGRELVPFARGSEGAKAFVQWKQARLTDALVVVAGKIRQARPDMPIMFDAGAQGGSMSGRGMAPDVYLRRGLVDVVEVRMDKDVAKSVSGAVRLADGAATRTAFMLSFTQTSQTLASQIGAVRRGKSAGYVVTSSKLMTADHGKALSGGPQAKPSISPFGPPAPPPAATPAPVPTPRPTPTASVSNRQPLEKLFLNREAALQQARASGRKVLVFFHTRENPACLNLWARMVASADFYDAAGKYVLAGIDTKATGNLAASTYGVYKIPAFAILASDGAVDKRLMNPESMEELLRFMAGDSR